MLKRLHNILKPKPKLPYQIIGEEKGVYQLVKNFYEIMETDPKAIHCLNVHQLIENKVPDEVKKKLFMFLCGWFGGPNLFVESFGPPRMKARHIKVKIGEQERDEWLYCMQLALAKHPFPLKKKERQSLHNSFWALATRIQNN